MARKVLIQIEVENVGAARRLEALREEIRRLNKEIKGAEIGTQAYNDLIARITDAKLEAAKLREEQKALNREFKAVQVPKDSLAGLRIEYAKLTEQIKVLSAVERQSKFGQDIIRNAANVKKEIDEIEQSIGRFTGNVGNYRSAFQGLQTVFLTLGAGIGVNEIIQSNTRLSDSIANVAKTTGLTIDEAKRLQTTLEARNTRTSIFDQLKIAEIGGQLGIANDQLEAFTSGVDILNVALGDQFGSVDILTREFAGLRNILTDFKTEDVAGDILKLGNAVNYLESQGNATGQSIVDFVSRIAGAGVPLDATTSQIIGLSTALSELQINPERGATAVSRLLTELAKSPQVFAKVIGESEAEFTKLVQTDIVGALTLVSQKIATNSKANTEFAKALDDLGIGAQGAIEVFGKLGGSTDLLKLRIKEAGEALQNTNSITREFEVKNNNAAAAVDKLKNAIISIFTGERAQDAIEGIAGALTGFVNVLGDAVEFLGDNKAITLELAAALIYLNRQGVLQALPFLKTLVVQLGLYTVAADGSLVATNALATAQGRASVATNAQALATRGLTLAMSALPLLAIIAATYALVEAWDAYQDSASASEKATRAVADAQEEIAAETAKEVSALERNIEILKSETTSKGLRKKAIDELLKIYPDYLKGVDLEKASIAQLTQIQDDLTASIYASSIARQETAADEKLVQQRIKNEQQLLQLEETLGGLSQKNDKARGALAAVGQARAAEGVSRIQEQINALEKENEKIEQQREIQKRQFAELRARLTGELPTQQFNKVTNFADELGVSFENVAYSVKALSGETGEAGENLDNTISGLKGRIEALNRELETTPIGSARFAEIQAEIGRLQNRLDAFSTKKARGEVDAQFGSISALRAEISKLEKQIEATAPEPQLLTPLIERLNKAQDKLEKASLLLEELKNRAAGGVEITLEIAQLPTLAIPSSVEAQSEADKIKGIQRDLFDNATRLIKQQEQERADAAEKERARQEELADLARESAFEAAQSISNSVFEIQRNRLEQQTQLQIDQLDIETQARIAAAKGNETKIAAIEKDALKKREAIERAAAEKRKQSAITEAIINTALAVTKALTGAPPPANLILAGVALAQGVAQQAVIRSQEFAEGGVADIKKLKPGVVKERPNAPRTAKGDNILAYLKNKEMVLTLQQQKRVREEAGMDIFARAGVPGEAATRHYGGGIREMIGKDAFELAGVPSEASTRRGRLQAFASGGIVGIVPQNGFARQTTTQAVTVQAKAEFSNEQVTALGNTLGTIIGDLVERGAFNGTLLGNDESNRMAERQAAMQQIRKG